VALLAARFEAPVLLAEEVPHRQSYFLGLQRADAGHAYLAFGSGVANDSSEVELRLCPVTEADARGLADYAWRRSGVEPPAGLRAVLTGLSEIALARPDIEVIDINPLVTDLADRLSVLDAKVYRRVGGRQTEAEYGPAVD